MSVLGAKFDLHKKKNNKLLILFLPNIRRSGIYKTVISWQL